jgi:hypothetical protein
VFLCVNWHVVHTCTHTRTHTRHTRTHILGHTYTLQERSRLLRQIQEAEEKEAGGEGVAQEKGPDGALKAVAARKKELSIKHPAAKGVFNALFRPAK